MTLSTVAPRADTALARSPLSFLIAFSGAVLALFLFLGLFESLGIPNAPIAYAALIGPLALYAAIGLRSRTLHRGTFFTVDRTVPAIPNAMAAAAGGLSGLVFVGYAGMLYIKGYDAFAYGLGWAGGHVLITVAIAPYLRKARLDTVADFFAVRFEGSIARLAAVVILFACALPLMLAQLSAFATVLARFLDLTFATGVYVGLAMTLATLLLGGMRGLTWTQAAQYVVIAASLIATVVWMSMQATGSPFAYWIAGDIVQETAKIERSTGGTASSALAALVEPDVRHGAFDTLNFLALIVVLAVGTASFPHILARAQTTPSVRQTRRSMAWSLAFLALLLLTAVAYAALVRFSLVSSVAGLTVADLAGHADWIFRWGSAAGGGLVSLCGLTADSLTTVVAACGGLDHIIMPSDIALDARAVVFAGPEIAGMPFVMTALVTLGALSAFLAMTNGLLFTLATALGHDLYAELGDRHAPAPRRLYFTRLALLAVVGTAGILALRQPADILSAAAWSFSLAGAGFFPALVLGIWWQRTTAVGAVGGMIIGFGITLAYIVINVWGIDLIKGNGDEIAWTLGGLTDGVLAVNAGIFGIPAGFIATIVLSLISPAPEPDETAIARAARRRAPRLFPGT